MECLNTKNLYIKSWFLEPATIEERLKDFPFPWKRLDRQFFFSVTAENDEAVREAITPVNLENGSVIYESPIDYVTSSPEGIIRQLREEYGDRLTITCGPSKKE